MCKGYATAQEAYDRQEPIGVNARQQGLLDELCHEEGKLRNMEIEQDEAISFTSSALYLSFYAQDIIKENYATRIFNQQSRVEYLRERIREAS